MTPTSPQPGAAPRSRLEPEPLPRRDFLGLSAVWAALATLFFALLGTTRLPKAAVVPVPSRKFRVTLPESLAPGEPLLPPGRSVAIYRDAEGVYAVSRICTHLGCVVKVESDGFHCPCHGSRFAPDGGVIKGPAPKRLAWIAITRVSGATYIVDEAKTVQPGTKVSV